VSKEATNSNALSFLVLWYFALKGFSLGTLVFSSHQKPKLETIIIIITVGIQYY